MAWRDAVALTGRYHAAILIVLSPCSRSVTLARRRAPLGINSFVPLQVLLPLLAYSTAKVAMLYCFWFGGPAAGLVSGARCVVSGRGEPCAQRRRAAGRARRRNPEMCGAPATPLVSWPVAVGLRIICPPRRYQSQRLIQSVATDGRALLFKSWCDLRTRWRTCAPRTLGPN